MANFSSDAWISSNNDFSADLFSRLSCTPGNIIISPFSILSALYLLLNGTKGNLQSSLAKTLKLPDFKDDCSLVSSASEQFLKLQQLLGRSESFSQADRLFVDKDSVEQVLERYRDKVEPLDLMNQVESIEKINNWVSKSTRGLISELLKADDLPQDLKLMLINVIVFQGVWEKKFNPEFMFKSKFTNADGSKSLVEYLFSEEKKYYANPKLGDHEVQVVALKYSSSNLAMMLVLPDEPDALEKIIKNLHLYQKNLLNLGLKFIKVDLQLPKFKLDTEVDLSSVLSCMGLESAFTTGGDFSGIFNSTDLLKIGSIQHAVSIKVDENGTEVAAATKVDAVFYSLQDDEDPRVILNRPFLFYIIDQETKLPVFMGVVRELKDVSK